MLNNKRIASLILKESSLCRGGVFYDICDGSIYRDDQYFKEHKNALVLLLSNYKSAIHSEAMLVITKWTCFTTLWLI